MSFILVSTVFTAQDMYKVEGYSKILQRQVGDSTFIRLNLEISDQFIFNNPDTARYYALRALERAESIKDTLRMAKACNYLGIACYSQGRSLTALEYYQRSQNLYKAAKDQTGALKAINNIGILYNDMKDHVKAIGIYREAYNENRAMGQAAVASSNLYNIVAGFIELENFDSAKANIAVLEQIHLQVPDAINPCSLKAEVYIKENKLDSALACVIEAFKISKDEGDEFFMANMLLRKAEIFRRKKSFLEAELSMFEANKLIKKNDFSELKLSCLEFQANLFSEIGLHQKAFEAQKSYTSLKDSLDRINNFNRISELNARYESEKRDGQIVRQEQTIKAKTNQFRFALVGGVGILLFSGLTFINLRRNRRLNFLLKTQNSEIKVQRQKILSSIDYAKRIQGSILPDHAILKRYFDEHFIYFKPKDIVSGDFYWFRYLEGKLYIAIIDCTGHGVPGAFMSIIANSKMNKAVDEMKLRDPGEILLSVHNSIIQLLHQRDLLQNAQDGMDMSLCAIDFNQRTIDFSGANNSILLSSKGQLTEYRSNPISVGGTIYSRLIEMKKTPFNTTHINYLEGDHLFMFTDGLVDQMGGEDGIKLNKSRFRELIGSIAAGELNKGEEVCNRYMAEWKHGQVQTDDILLFGAKLK